MKKLTRDEMKKVIGGKGDLYKFDCAGVISCQPITPSCSSCSLISACPSQYGGCGLNP